MIENADMLTPDELEFAFRSRIEELQTEIGRLTGLVDGLTDDALLMRELKAAVRGMSGIHITYTGPKQDVGRGLVTDEELRRIDRILNRIETEANQGI